MVQGVTELLLVELRTPALFQQWLPPVGDHVAFDLVLHLGTLVPVLFVYRDELLGIPRDILGGEGPLLQRTGVRLLMLMTIGSIPTAAIGLVFQDVFEQLFANPVSVGVAFAVTGFVLFATRYIRQGDATENSTRWWQAVMVGIAQGIAITPGVSRSGSTIAAGLLLGFKREFAARYSFLRASLQSRVRSSSARDLEPAHVAVGPPLVDSSPRRHRGTSHSCPSPRQDGRFQPFCVVPVGPLRRSSCTPVCDERRFAAAGGRLDAGRGPEYPRNSQRV